MFYTRDLYYVLSFIFKLISLNIKINPNKYSFELVVKH